MLIRRISLVVLLAAFCLSVGLLLMIGPTPLQAHCEPGDEACETTPDPQEEDITDMADNYTGAPFSLIDSLGSEKFQRLSEEINQTCGSPSGQNVYFKKHEFVNASGEPQTVDVEMALHSGGPLDPFLHIYDNDFDKNNPADNCIKVNDNTHSSTGSVIRRFTWPAGQRLVIVAMGKNAGETGNYRLEIRPAGQDDNDRENARSISPNIDWVTDEISPTGDIDFFRFQAKDGQRVWVYVRTDQSTAGKDSQVELLKLQTDGSTSLIEDDDNDGGQQNGTSSSVAGAKIGSTGIFTYYVRVESADSNPITPYYLYVYLSDQDTIEEDDTGAGNNSRSTANGYGSDGKHPPQIFNGLQDGGDPDFFKFSIPSDAVVLTGVDTDPNDLPDDFRGQLELYDSASDPLVVSATDSIKDANPSVALSYGQVSSETVDATTWYASVISDAVGTNNLSYHLLVGYSPTAQGDVTFSTDVNKTIPTSGTITSTLISGNYCINNLDVWLDIDHARLDDLSIYLTGPDDTTVELFTNRGGDDDGLIITLDDEGSFAPLPDDGISGPDVKIGGRYQTEGSRLNSFAGKIGVGQWVLSITDDTGGNTGTLNNWALLMHCAGGQEGIYLPIILKNS